MALTTYAKRSVTDVIEVPTNWTDFLGSDSISTVSYAVSPSGSLSVLSSSHASGVSYVFLQSGTAGSTYVVSATVTTTGGRTETKPFLVVVGTRAEDGGFTYDLASPTDTTRVRFHTGDTDSAAPLFTDEEIQFVISEQGTWKKAVIACLENLKARLATSPEFTADWLSVRNGSSLAGLDALIAAKRRELGVSMLTASVSYQYRPDSYQTESPTYPETDTE